MATRVSPNEIFPDAIRTKKVAIVGYGNQGRAHALNLRDSSIDVVVGGRPGRSWSRAEEDGFHPVALEVSVRSADIVMLSLPDGPMAEIVHHHVVPHLRPGQSVLFAHGFNVVFHRVQLPENVDVAMVSPKGAGYGVRLAYEQGSGVPALIAVHHDASGEARARALAYAWGIGCARSLILETTFREETVTDLFGEQAVLCGGIPELIRAAFHTLVARGYSPEVAYFECLHETKLIVDLLVAKGIAGMRESISDTAAWGGLSVGPTLVDASVQAKLDAILEKIESGVFAQEWVEEQATGLHRFKSLAAAEHHDPIERVGDEVRSELKRTNP